MHIQKKLRNPLFLIGIFLCFCFNSCQQDEGSTNQDTIESLREQVAELTEEKAERDHFIKTLNQELININSIFDSISYGRDDLSTPGFNGLQTDRKIAMLSHLLDSSDQLINQLNLRIQNSNQPSEITSIANNLINSLRSDLERSQAEIQNLRATNQSLAQQLGTVEKELNSSNQEVEGLTVDKNNLLQKKAEIQRQMAALDQELAQKEEEYKKKIKAVSADAEFEIAMNYFDLLEKVKDKKMMQKKKKLEREQWARNALEHFKNAQKYGNNTASKYIKKLYYEEPYNRILDIRPPD